MDDPKLPQYLNGVINDLEVYYRKLDKQIVERVRLTLLQEKMPPETSCSTCTKAGCCRLSIFEPLYAGFPVARHLRVTGKDTPELRERLRTLGERMEAAGRDAWFEENEACAFLRDERCTIYQWRPIACRKYYVSSPAELCNPPPNPDQMICSIDMGIITASSMFTSGQFGELLALKQNRMRMYIGTFPRIVYISLLMLEYIAEGGRDLATWLRQFPWPTEDNGNDWLVEGKNPFRDKLHGPQPSV